MSKRIQKWLIAYIIFFIDVQVSYGAERIEFFNGVRQMGMGGASIGVVNDETSLLSNPNGLGKLRSHIFTIFDPEGSASSNFAEYITDGEDPFDYFSLEGIVDALQETTDEHIHSKVQVFPSFVFQNFGIGLFKKLNYNATSSTDGTNVDFTFYDDTALLLGYNFRFFGGRVKLGFTGKYINRAVAAETLALSTTNADVEDYIKEGVGVGADVGLTLTGPWKWLPSISTVVRNAGRTSFRHASGMFYSSTEVPDSLPQTYDVAFSLFPIHSNRVRSSLTFELVDVENVQEEEDWRRRAHLGWELNMSDVFFLRAGMNQRYWTAGFEFSMENVQLQVATFGEDIGPDEDPEENRRFVFKVAYRF